MICPFCQADLDPRTMACPRCGAAYRGGGSGLVLSVRLRMLVLAFVTLVITSLVLVDCVLHRLPREGALPDMKSAEAQRALLMMEQHQQGTQNAGMPPLRR